MRTSQDINLIKSRITDPYSINDFITLDQVNHLINLFESQKVEPNTVYKNTGPITLDIKDYLQDAVISTIIEKLKKEFNKNIHLQNMSIVPSAAGVRFWSIDNMPRRWIPLVNPISFKSSSLMPSTITCPATSFFSNANTVSSEAPWDFISCPTCLGLILDKASRLTTSALTTTVLTWLAVTLAAGVVKLERAKTT